MTQSRKATLGPRPLTARSALLSALLGTSPPRLPVSKLVAVAELFGISEGAARTALSRMTAAGDVSLENGRYRLSPRLMDRQRRQDQSRGELRQPWNGRWVIAIVGPQPRAAAERTALRRAMHEQRLGQWREGVWLRPDNLGPRRSPTIERQCTVWIADAPAQPPQRQIVARLWDLEAWAERARDLVDAFAGPDQVADRFMIAAATLRHLLGDPLLPDGLAPDDWPAALLRQRFTSYYQDLQTELAHFLRS